MEKYCLAYSTFPDERDAFRISELAIKEKLAACCNISGKITSIYMWEGELQNGNEVSVWFKTTETKYAELEHMIKKNHPYENACVIMLEIKAGSPEFLKWISESVK